MLCPLHAVRHMLTLELEAVRVALYSGAADPEATDAMLAEDTLDLLQAAALYKVGPPAAAHKWRPAKLQSLRLPPPQHRGRVCGLCA